MASKNADDPFFSIIIPTRNRATLLNKCIASVIGQIYQNWELIIVDDGSEDDTKKIVEAVNDERIHYVYQEHQERSTARNRGIDEARGQYVCFIDDDDYVTPTYLSDFYNFYDENEFGDVILRTGFVKLTDNAEIRSKNYVLRRDKNPVNFVLFNMCGVGSVCIPRMALSNDKFPESFPHWQDTHLIVRLLLKHDFIQLDNHNYTYVQHDSMGSRKATVEFDPIERANLNVAAMEDVFLNFGESIHKYTRKTTLSFLKAEKYIEYANSLSMQEGDNRKKLVAKSLESGLFLKLWKHYLIYLKVKAVGK